MTKHGIYNTIFSRVHIKHQLLSATAVQSKLGGIMMENFFTINIILLVSVVIANIFGPVFVRLAEKEYVKCLDDGGGYWPSPKLDRLEWMAVIFSSIGGYFFSLWTARRVNYKEKDERSRFYRRMHVARLISIGYVLCAIAFTITTKS